MTRFTNPLNNYAEDGGTEDSWLWCLLFGPGYFIYKGLWGWAALWMLAAVLSLGLAWLAFPAFARGIVDRHYRRAGWREESEAVAAFLQAAGARGRG